MMEVRTDRHLSSLGLVAAGVGFCAGLAVLTAITVRMAVPANVTAANDFGPTDEGQSQDSIGDMCRSMLKGRTDLMAQCREEEQTALQYVNAYLQANDLLADDGSIDEEKLADAASNTLSAVDDDPATIVSFCLQSALDWIGTQDCINSLDSDAAYKVLGPDAGPAGGNDLLPGGAN